jgi:hypothetical protein
MSSHVEEVIAASKRRATRQGENELCPFCQIIPSQTQKGFASHVGKHLREISLAALPALNSCSDSESDGSDGDDGDDDEDGQGGNKQTEDGAEDGEDGKSCRSNESCETLTDRVSRRVSISQSTEGSETTSEDNERDTHEVSPAPDAPRFEVFRL